MRVLAATCLLMIAGQALAAEPVTLLSKSWQVGYAAQDDQQQVTEYVQAGETVENWTQLVTHQVIIDPDGKFELKKLLKLMRAGFGPDCINFEWKVVEQSKTHAVYTWTHDGCANARAEAERAVMIRTPKGLCRWSYSTRHVPMHVPSLADLDAELAKLPCE
jgi:hypothetical protein